MWNFFRKKENPLAKKFRDLAESARLLGTSPSKEATGRYREEIEDLLRLHFDEPEVQKRKAQLYHFLIDTHQYGTRDLEGKIDALLAANYLNHPYNDPEFIVYAIVRESLENLVAACVHARRWHKQLPGDKERQKLLRALLIRAHDFVAVAPISRMYFETNEDEFAKDSRGYFQVFDAEGEHEYVRGEQCNCGSFFQWTQHNNRSNEGLTENIGKCDACSATKTFLLSNANKTFHANLERVAKQLGL